MTEGAGILPFRRKNGVTEVLLLHLAGPLWANRDKWHFAKGHLDPGEDWLEAAKREFREEVGIDVPDVELIDLGKAKQHSKRVNYIWAIENDVDLSNFPSTIVENVFDMEWPLKSGRIQTFPENDRAEWFTLEEARPKIFVGLVVYLDRLAEYLNEAASKTNR